MSNPSLVKWIWNPVRNKSIPVWIKPYGSGYYRPTGQITAAISAGTQQRLVGRLDESFAQNQLFEEALMKDIGSLSITNVTEHVSNHPEPHWDIDASDDAGNLLKNGHLTTDAAKQTAAKK